MPGYGTGRSALTVTGSDRHRGLTEGWLKGSVWDLEEIDGTVRELLQLLCVFLSATLSVICSLT